MEHDTFKWKAVDFLFGTFAIILVNFLVTFLLLEVLNLYPDSSVFYLNLPGELSLGVPMPIIAVPSTFSIIGVVLFWRRRNYLARGVIFGFFITLVLVLVGTEQF